MADSESSVQSRPEPNTTTSNPARKSRPSILRDPVVRRLAFFAGALVVLYLVTILAALVMGVVGSDVPRTRLAVSLTAAEKKTVDAPSDPEAWAEYARLLMADGQKSKAQSVIDQASEVVDQSASQTLLAAQANLHYENRRYAEAISTSDKVRAKLKAYHAKRLGDPKSDESKGKEIHPNYYEVLILKAECLVKMDDTKAAEAVLTEYLKAKPTAADVLIRRGDLRAELKDTKGAKADYNTALKYLPDNTAALEGLKKIGAN